MYPIYLGAGKKLLAIVDKKYLFKVFIIYLDEFYLGKYLWIQFIFFIPNSNQRRGKSRVVPFAFFSFLHPLIFFSFAKYYSKTFFIPSISHQKFSVIAFPFYLYLHPLTLSHRTSFLVLQVCWELVFEVHLYRNYIFNKTIFRIYNNTPMYS